MKIKWVLIALTLLTGCVYNTGSGDVHVSAPTNAGVTVPMP